MSKIIGRPLYAPAPAGGGASPQLLNSLMMATM